MKVLIFFVIINLVLYFGGTYLLTFLACKKMVQEWYLSPTRGGEKRMRFLCRCVAILFMTAPLIAPLVGATDLASYLKNFNLANFILIVPGAWLGSHSGMDAGKRNPHPAPKEEEIQKMSTSGAVIYIVGGVVVLALLIVATFFS